MKTETKKVLETINTNIDFFEVADFLPLSKPKTTKDRINAVEKIYKEITMLCMQEKILIENEEFELATRNKKQIDNCSEMLCELYFGQINIPRLLRSSREFCVKMKDEELYGLIDSWLD